MAKDDYRDIICIVCPNACRLGVHYDAEREEILQIDNLKCPRGKDYAAEEIFNPTRTLTTVVPIVSDFWKVTSVRTSRPVPKGKIFDVYEEISRIRLKAPVKLGDVIIENVCGLDVDVIVTRGVDH